MIKLHDINIFFGNDKILEYPDKRFSFSASWLLVLAISSTIIFRGRYLCTDSSGTTNRFSLTFQARNDVPQIYVQHAPINSCFSIKNRKASFNDLN